MELTWDTPYAVAMELRRTYPQVDLEDVSLAQISEWTVALPAFNDDLALCNEQILASIFQEWYEVMTDG